jgi:hypothetical protein
MDWVKVHRPIVIQEVNEACDRVAECLGAYLEARTALNAVMQEIQPELDALDAQMRGRPIVTSVELYIYLQYDAVYKLAQQLALEEESYTCEKVSIEEKIRLLHPSILEQCAEMERPDPEMEALREKRHAVETAHKVKHRYIYDALDRTSSALKSARILQEHAQRRYTRAREVGEIYENPTLAIQKQLAKIRGHT